MAASRSRLSPDLAPGLVGHIPPSWPSFTLLHHIRLGCRNSSTPFLAGGRERKCGLIMTSSGPSWPTNARRISRSPCKNGGSCNGTRHFPREGGESRDECEVAAPSPGPKHGVTPTAWSRHHRAGRAHGAYKDQLPPARLVTNGFKGRTIFFFSRLSWLG